MQTRVTPINIKELKAGEVFVFGSNATGSHLDGAAKIASEKFGAVFGQSFGFQGRSFGINTMSGISVMKQQVESFIKYAKYTPSLTFLVTEIGCGIAGYIPKQIAPLFKDTKTIENVKLPETFWTILNEITL